jgi:hypothetical protein
VKSAGHQLLAKLARIPIRSVSEDRVTTHIAGHRSVELPQRDLVFGSKLDLLRNTGLIAPLPVGGPWFWQKQIHRDARAAGLSG